MRSCRFLIRLPFLLACCVASPLLVAADEPVPVAGHSQHGDAFNEGPRQAAILLGNTGNVHFPVTSAHPQVQGMIDQGVGQLHGFWYWEAERSFRQAAAFDPECASAYWGMAMANLNNESRGRKFLQEALARKDQASPREKLYLHALDQRYKRDDKDEREKKERATAYLKALEKIVLDYPDDLEAKAFLCCAIYESRSEVPIGSHVAAASLMREVLAVNPLHPVHHYVIHLWDYERPAEAVGSAARCGQSAPGIAHMWHMPGHIFSRLHRYEDAIWQQEASSRVDHASMIRDRLLPDQIHNYAHNQEWMIRNLVFAGRVSEATTLAKDLLDNPHHPRWNKLSSGSAQYGRTRLFQVLNEFELWPQLIAECHTQSLPPTADEAEQVKRLRHLGRAWYRTGRLSSAREQQQLVQQRRDRLHSEQEIAAARAVAKAKGNPQEKKSSDDVAKEARRPWEQRIRPLEKTLEEFAGHELLAIGKPKDALARFKSAGGMDELFLAEIQFQAGEQQEAIKSVQNHLKSHRNETRPLAVLVKLLWDHGDRAAAFTRFRELQELSESIDLTAPVFARLAPLAAAWGQGDDWRAVSAPRSDTGERPALETLGPLYWSPPVAPAWQLPDGEGQPHLLAEYRGRPVLVIFYLGHGCLHCAEQLQKFAPRVSDFAAAGIEMVAISTDNIADLKKSQQLFSAAPFPIPLLSDAEQRVFRQYRAFDDFENRPLHGTFLIDADGRTRWWDISHEPFMDADFVLREARRQLQPGIIERTPETPFNADAPADALQIINPAGPPNAQPAAGEVTAALPKP